tara:strand:+ start:958 stop:1545 length:588 start_codon:yes stop_codon:yes gene_type:complete
MIKQNLYIIAFNELYKILDEIKENFFFNIDHYNNEETFLKDPNIVLENSLIISKSSEKLLSNKKLTKKNFLDLDLFPIELNKLIELINIQLIRIKFNDQTKIIIKDYELNLNSKFIYKKDLNLKLTEKEIQIILHLNYAKTKQDVLELQKNIWGYSSDVETHTVETHIYRLRTKIKNKFNDKNFILTQQNGYYIN